MAALSNKYSFCQHLHATPFCTQTNLRENRLFAAKWMIGWKKGTHNIKILAENWTKQRLAIYKHMRIGIVSTTFTTASPCGCRACCPRPIMAAPCKRRNNLSATAGFQLVDNTMYPYRLLHSLSKNKVVFHSFLSTFRVFVGVLPVLLS